MLKVMGIVLVASSVSVYGVMCSQRIKDSAKIREEICSFIGEIERGISFGRRRLCEIISGISSPLLAKSGFLQAINNQDDCKHAVNTYLSQLTDDEKNKLIYFLSNIGKSPFSEKEILLCKEYRLYFEEKTEIAKKDAAVKAELYKKIGIICAIGCGVIFL